MHLITHRVAIQRPHMDFENPGLGFGDHSTADISAGEVQDGPAPGPRFMGGWLEFWDVEDEEQPLHDFVVTEPSELSWESVDTPSQE